MTKKDMETEAMVIRPPKDVADWLRRVAVDETMQQGRTVTPNKMAVVFLAAAMKEGTGGGRGK